MRQLQVNALVALTATSIFLFVLFVPGVSAQPSLCAGADALREAKLYTDAKAVYVALLNENPQLDCAVDGIEAIAAIENSEPSLSCTTADTLRTVKLYEEAKKTYVALLDANPELNCAIDGIRAIAAIENIDSSIVCQTADTLREARLYEDAKEIYVTLLNENPELDCAINGIIATAAIENIETFKAVRTLNELGLYTLAAQQLQEVSKQNPGGEVPDDLTYLIGGLYLPWLQLRERAEWFGRPALQIGSIILLFGLVALVARPMVQYRITPLLFGWRKAHLDIHDFDAGASELTIGKGIAAMVEDCLLQLSSQTEISLPTLVTGPLAPLEIPAEIRGLIPSVNIAARFLEWALPPRDITLSGYLQKAGEDGVGITVSLVDERSKQILASETIWQRKYDPHLTLSSADGKNPAPYYILVRYVASWVFFRVNTYL